jgi:acetyltransferase-like isoleucine patch superfamily enzyme
MRENLRKYYAHPTAVVESKDIGEGSKIWHFVHIREGARVGKNCNIGKGVYIDRDVVIGNNVKIQNFTSIYKGVRIEDDVFIGPSVIFTNDLLPRAFRWGDDLISKTTVRKGASIGANSTIICGIEIGGYAMIGAGSVVTKNVPEFALVYGNPARLKGFVCFCGKKLTDDPKAKGEYKCNHCGEVVRIR